MREWARRVILSYLIVYNFPFPLGVLPGTEWAGTAVEAGKSWVIRMIVQLTLGIDVTTAVTGSGDTTESYLRLFVQVGLAVLAATAWHAWRRGAPVSTRTKDMVMVGARYVLGAAMLAYGWYKLIPTQMPPPGPDRLMMPIGDASPMGLLWTMMGASPAYQMFSGLCEAVSGLLLFWRRTTLLGALMAAGVLTNVVALNFCYDVPVKLYSLQLLLTAVFIIAPHATRLVDLFWRNRPAPAAELRPFPLGRGWARWTALGVKAVLVARLIGGPMIESYQSARQFGFLSPAHALHGTYVVTSFTASDGRGPIGDGRWIRIGIDGRSRLATIQRAGGTMSRHRLEVDEGQGTLTLQGFSRAAPARLRYHTLEPGVVQVEGTFESAPIVAVLRKAPEGSVLTTRGFHWISEYPYNR